MPPDWIQQLKINPVPALLSCGDKAAEYFTRRDLLEEAVEPITTVWQLPPVQRIMHKQQPDGSWRPSGKKPTIYPENHYELVETWRNLRILVERYELTTQHPTVEKASEYLFRFQTPEGDIRGMLANQYTTYYTGAMLAVLIKAGYADDPRVSKGMDWLLSMRQNDGGWTIPILTRGYSQTQINQLTATYAQPVEPDKSLPFSHNWTDMALRPFAAHHTRRSSKQAHKAADLLKSAFFQPDYYTSYKDARYWVRFMFWWPNLLTALETLLQLGYTIHDPDIQNGLSWLTENQQPNGLWRLDYCKKAKEKPSAEQYWLALRIVRVFRGFYS